jgi:hypothetical protein
MTTLADAPQPEVIDLEPQEPLLAEGPPPQRWWQNPDVRAALQIVLTVAVVAGSSLYVLAQMQPQLIIDSNTPTGGDFGAHVFGPAFLRDHILPNWRLNGWSPDWYGGFPMYRFYMVVPGLLTVLLDVLLPYGVALKIVSVLGLVALPVCAWAFGKLSDFPFPIPPLMSIAAVFFVFDETFTIYGGNAASTMAGEFSFALALPLGLLFLGVFAKGMRDGTHRATAAVLFALAALCHLIVAIYLVVATILLFLLYADRKRLKYLVTMAPVAGLLTAFWVLPFYLGGPYMTDMFYDRRPYGNAPNGQPDSYWQMLFPHGQWIDLALMQLAVIAVIASIAKGRRVGVFLGVCMVVFGTWAVVWPQSHLWNARILPFFYLSRYLLVAIGVAELAVFIYRYIAMAARERAEIAPTHDLAVRRERRASRLSDPGARWLVGGAVLVVGALLSLLVLGMRFQRMPFGEFVQRGGNTVYQWPKNIGLLSSTKGQFVDDWARWNYSGYEGKPAYGEYRDVVMAMDAIGQERGCGRALWEHNSGSYGTPMALMLLPFWTDGCIGSMEGLYFEASGTTPYHFLAAAAGSKQASNPVRRLAYVDNDVALAVRHMRDLGIRYYMAYTPEVIAQADQLPELTPLRQAGPWKIYEVAGADLVVPLTEEPIVVNGLQPKVLLGMGDSRDRWLEVGTSWFQHPEDFAGLPVADGPDEWQRVDVGAVDNTVTTGQTLARVRPIQEADARSLPEVTVSDVSRTTDSISFTVDQIGVPVLVRESYFPNWEVSGAEGPYRVAPNFMVVIPTGNRVTLEYGTSTSDWLAWILTGVGLVLLVVLWKLGPVRYDDEDPNGMFVWEAPGAPPAERLPGTVTGEPPAYGYTSPFPAPPFPAPPFPASGAPPDPWVTTFAPLSTSPSTGAGPAGAGDDGAPVVDPDSDADALPALGQPVTPHDPERTGEGGGDPTPPGGIARPLAEPDEPGSPGGSGSPQPPAAGNGRSSAEDPGTPERPGAPE